MALILQMREEAQEEERTSKEHADLGFQVPVYENLTSKDFLNIAQYWGSLLGGSTCAQMP